MISLAEWAEAPATSKSKRVSLSTRFRARTAGRNAAILAEALTTSRRKHVAAPKGGGVHEVAALSPHALQLVSFAVKAAVLASTKRSWRSSSRVGTKGCVSTALGNAGEDVEAQMASLEETLVKFTLLVVLQ